MNNIQKSNNVTNNELTAKLLTHLVIRNNNINNNILTTIIYEIVIYMSIARVLTPPLPLTYLVSIISYSYVITYNIYHLTFNI